MNGLADLSDYVINFTKLNKLSNENPKLYKDMLEFVHLYLNSLKDMAKIDSMNIVAYKYTNDYKLLLENTLLNETILVKKRVSKIEKILNSK